MAYDKFDILNSTGVPLPIENVDTDQIIPARFLKATERVGFGDNLFRDWRYNSDDTPKKDFVLNNPTYSGKILVGGKNFGSGSSREHAAWAIYDYGFRCVVSSFFADIFRNNCLNIGVLPVQVSPEFLQQIFSAIEADPNSTFTVNLPQQKITIDSTAAVETFDINPYKKDNMTNGFDDIDYLLNIKKDIKDFAHVRHWYFTLLFGKGQNTLS
ncbi:MAG: 3-isopropylmalate dehydratase small subunit, partial [Flavobacteriaceae bacterium]